MSKMKKTVSVIVVAVLVGCATPLTLKPPQVSAAEAAQCVQDAPDRMKRAKQGDKYEQYNVGKNLFFGCTEDRVSNPEKALPWLKLSAEQNYLGATALIGGGYYATSALNKHAAGQDWADDARMADRYTDAALELWEKAGRTGFSKVALAQLQDAANYRGLIQRRIHNDKSAAEKSYCLSLEINPDNSAVANYVVMNLAAIGKTTAVCKLTK